MALPQGIAINKQDEVYIADTYNNRIQVFDKKEFQRVIGTGSAGLGPYQFYHPRGINFESISGSLYVADTYNNRIMKFTNKDQFLYTVGNFFSLFILIKFFRIVKGISI